MNNFFGNQLLDMLQEIISGCWSTFFSYIESFYLNTNWITGNSYVNNAQNISNKIATSFLVLVMTKHIFTTYILETDGDPDVDPLQYLVKGSVALACIQMQSFLFNYLLKLSNLLCAEVCNGLVPQLTNDFSELLKSIATLMGSIAFTPIMLCIYIICIFILIIKAAMRAVELAIMKVLFPLMCCDMITPSRERWSAFLVTYLATFFGYIIQIFCIRLSMILFLSFESISVMIGAAALLFFAMKTPKWLEKFVYSSGLGNTVSGTARNGMFVAMSMYRMR